MHVRPGEETRNSHGRGTALADRVRAHLPRQSGRCPYRWRRPGSSHEGAAGITPPASSHARPLCRPRSNRDSGSNSHGESTFATTRNISSTSTPVPEKRRSTTRSPSRRGHAHHPSVVGTDSSISDRPPVSGGLGRPPGVRTEVVAAAPLPPPPSCRPSGGGASGTAGPEGTSSRARGRPAPRRAGRPRIRHIVFRLAVKCLTGHEYPQVVTSRTPPGCPSPAVPPQGRIHVHGLRHRRWSGTPSTTGWDLATVTCSLRELRRTSGRALRRPR
ncbi:hypothetical protein SAMN05216371_0160 [Streptomyces sp. TLI_053]|nr:hypothetical protein SAMN05216371_0160 [Streptomyces sp. TLI_053]